MPSFPTPTLKHIAHLQKSRELYGRIIQCRTNHGYTGSFRKRFRLQGDISCPCGLAEIETREHILYECPRYSNSRNILRKASTYLFLPEILGTTDGIKALSDFLRKSGAFSRTGTPPQPLLQPSFENEPDPNPEEDEPDDDS